MNVADWSNKWENACENHVNNKTNLSTEPVESFWRDIWITPTCDMFCSFSCKDRTWTEGCQDSDGEAGGVKDNFPSKLSGGTKSIWFVRLGPYSGLYLRGLDGKLPVNKGDDENGAATGIAL